MDSSPAMKRSAASGALSHRDGNHSARISPAPSPRLPRLRVRRPGHFSPAPSRRLRVFQGASGQPQALFARVSRTRMAAMARTR